MKESEGTKLANMLTDMVNNMNSDADEKDFTETISRSHRTLQQSFFKLLCRCIATWAATSKRGQFDLRNEFTVKECEKLAKILEEDYVIVSYPDSETRIITPYI